MMVARWFKGAIEIGDRLQTSRVCDFIGHSCWRWHSGDTSYRLPACVLLVNWCTRASREWNQPVYMFSIHDLVFLLFYLCRVTVLVVSYLKRLI